MSEDDESEIVGESYRRRIRLMDRLMAPFDILALLMVVVGVVGIVILALKVW